MRLSAIQLRRALRQELIEHDEHTVRVQLQTFRAAMTGHDPTDIEALARQLEARLRGSHAQTDRTGRRL